MIKILLGGIVVYGLICAGLYVFQRKILYLPERNELVPGQFNFSEASKVTLETTDSVKITVWYVAPKNSLAPTLIYFHGNAGHIGDRTEKLKAFVEQGWGIVALSYRGYGSSLGSPSELGLYEDARTAVRYAVHTLLVPLNQIVFYGESLGSGVAVQMATEFKARAIVLEAPYTSIDDLARKNYPIFPTHLLLRDHFRSIKKIESVSMPLLLMHGEKDTTIPVRYGRQLFAKASEPKKAVYFDHVGHTDFDVKLLAANVAAFLKENP